MSKIEEMAEYVKDPIRAQQVLTWRSALGLECRGMTRRGMSVYAIVKSKFGFKGDKLRVYNQLDAFIKLSMKPGPLRKVEYLRKSQGEEPTWSPCEMPQITKGMVFRMFEGDNGAPVRDGRGRAVFVASGDAYPSPSGVHTVDIEDIPETEDEAKEVADE